jgi:hypothetical protein
LKCLAATSSDFMSDEECIFKNLNEGSDLLTVEEFIKVIDKELASGQLGQV